KTTVGRDHEGELVVLAGSVSREHAEIKRTDGGWHVRDLGSRNGTFVDSTRAAGRAPLGSRSLIKIGDVALWFLAEGPNGPAGPPSMATASAGGGLVRYQLAPGKVELCLVGTTDTAVGGALLTRAGDTASWTERALAPLEYQLLRSLCARATEEAGSPSVVRG